MLPVSMCFQTSGHFTCEQHTPSHTHAHTRIFLANVILEVVDSCYLALIQIKLFLLLTLKHPPFLAHSVSCLSHSSFSSPLFFYLSSLLILSPLSLMHVSCCLFIPPLDLPSRPSVQTAVILRTGSCRALCAHTHVLLW